MRELGQQDPLVKVLFSRWAKDQPMQVIHTFYDLIDLLRDTGQDYLEDGIPYTIMIRAVPDE